MGFYMIYPIIRMFLPQVLMLIFVLVFLKIIISLLKKKNRVQVKNIKKSTYYRDIPCSGDIDIAFWLLTKFSDINKKGLNNGLFGAYILQWYKNGYIDIISTSNSGLKSGNFSIDLKDGNWEKSRAEEYVYNFLKEVAGNNNLVEKNEIRNYCSVDGNKYELERMFNDVLRTITNKLEEEGKIIVEKPKSSIFFNSQEKIKLSDQLVEELQNLYGLKNFLLDYSLMQEKMHIEVKIWEEYLVFANLLGIADKVQQQFKKIYQGADLNSKAFEISFSGTIVSFLNSTYRTVRIRLISILLCILYCILIVVCVDFDIVVVPIVVFPFVVVFAIFYWLLRKHYINKKVKEMNKKTYATVVDVASYEFTERDSDTGENVTRVSYTLDYEYTINGQLYKGSASSNTYKKRGQHIKIYYNEMKPEKSETAKKHNHYLKIFIWSLIGLIGVILLYAGLIQLDK